MEYDVIVIGAGPGGYPAAIRASQYGLKTAIIEEKEVGGTCLNKGCIPTKALYRISEEIEESKFKSIYKTTSFEWQKIISEIKTDVVLRLRAGINFLLKQNGIDVFNKKGSIVGANEVQVNGETIRGKNIIIATGSYPSTPDCFRNDERVITSDGLWNLEKLPESVAIIGGGVIGCEFASILNKFGVKVKIYEMMDTLLPGKDEEIVNILKNSFSKRGIEINLGKKLDSCDLIEGEKILLSIGRKPLLPEIEGIKIEIEKDGIKTDLKLKTNIENIYAIGDVNGKYQLAYVATKEGEIAVENIAGKETFMEYESIPEAIFTDPEIGVCGLTEKEAKEKGIKVKIGKFPYTALGKAYAEKSIEGMVKIVINGETDEIVGIHMIGKGATELVSFASLVIKNKMKVSQLKKILYPHPTFAESIMEAIEDLEGKSVHLPPKRV